MIPLLRGLTAAQRRIIRYCADWPDWTELADLDVPPDCLEQDDVVVVPSLIERRLMIYHGHFRAVRLTAAGMAVAHSLGWQQQRD